MNSNKSAIISFIQQYKIYILLILPIFIFLLASIFITSNDPQTNQTTSLTPTDTETNIARPKNTFVTRDPLKPTAAEGLGTDEDQPVNFYLDTDTRIEALPNGLTKYITPSTDPDRPIVVIARSDGSGVLFERSIVDTPDKPILVSTYIDIYGNPQQIKKGHTYYGPDAQVYIYADEGLAYIVGAITNSILEIHTFTPTTVNGYLQSYVEHL